MRLRTIKTALVIMIITALCCAFPGSRAIAEQADRNTLELYDGYGKVFYYIDEIIQPTDHLVSEELYSRKANYSPDFKSERVKAMVLKGISADKALCYAYPRLADFVLSVSKQCYVAPVDSKIRFNPNEKPVFTITRDREGRAVDTDALYRDIYRAWQSSVHARVRIRYKRISADISVEESKKQTHRRSAYCSAYATSPDNRKHNIALALEKINGISLAPGERFSFNSTVGKRSLKNGFKEAKIIVGGEYVDGYGGGVCQVSTALYNAAIRADLKIVSARSHSLPPAYVPASFDAMVSSGSSDLVIENTTALPIYIRAVTDGSKMTVEIYGEESLYQIRCESVIKRVGAVPDDKIIEDSEGKYCTPEMESGELVRVRGGIAGVESEGYLLYYREGELVERRLIRSDKYSAMCGILAKKP